MAEGAFKVGNIAERCGFPTAVTFGPRNVTVNILSPGFTDTDMFNQAAGETDSEQIRAGASLSPFNRIGSSEEVADVAAFLASDAARWVTGQNAQAGGGVV